jgi:hypothetical protein
MNKAIVIAVTGALAVAACGTRVEPSIGKPSTSPTPPPGASAAATTGATASPAATGASAAPTTSVAATATAAASAAPATSATPSATASSAATATPAATASASPGAGLPQGSDPVNLDPANFVAVIDNPWWPMTVGSEWEYREADADGTVQKIVVTVTDQTKQILGINSTVVHDVATEDGQTVEDTFDWYAQDRDGNIWYMGEDTKEYENGKVSSTEGSWQAGVDGAQPGIVVPAAPAAGMSYRQEYYANQAEDQAQVLSVNEQAAVAAGSYKDLLLTKEFTPLEPDVLEYKWYAQGVGEVLAITVSGGSDREELIRYSPAQ